MGVSCGGWDGVAGEEGEELEEAECSKLCANAISRFQFRSMVMFLADVARIMARPALELLLECIRGL